MLMHMSLSCAFTNMECIHLFTTSILFNAPMLNLSFLLSRESTSLTDPVYPLSILFVSHLTSKN